MFKKYGNEKALSEALNISEDNLDEYLKRTVGFLAGRNVSNISKRTLADSFFILTEIQKRESEKEAKRLKTLTKNPLLLKYEKTIIDLYRQGFGYVRISRALKVDHNANISKSTIERFIKNSGITRNG